MMDVRDIAICFPDGAGVTALFRADQPWRRFTPFRFTLVLSGAGTYGFDDGEVAVTAGDLLFIQPGRRLIRVAPELQVHWLPFCPRLAGLAGLAVQRLRPWRLGQKLTGDARVRQAAAAAFADLRLLVHASPAPARAALQVQVLLDLFAASGEAGAAAPPAGIQAAAQRLALEPEERLGVPELAGLAGLSASQFRRVFRRHYGVSPLQYAIDRRLDAAERLLRHEGLSVQETAAQLGYADAFTFSRQFRARHGRPPSRPGG